MRSRRLPNASPGPPRRGNRGPRGRRSRGGRERDRRQCRRGGGHRRAALLGPLGRASCRQEAAEGDPTTRGLVGDGESRQLAARRVPRAGNGRGDVATASASWASPYGVAPQGGALDARRGQQNPRCGGHQVFIAPRLHRPRTYRDGDRSRARRGDRGPWRVGDGAPTPRLGGPRRVEPRGGRALSDRSSRVVLGPADRAVSIGAATGSRVARGRVRSPRRARRGTPILRCRPAPAARTLNTPMKRSHPDRMTRPRTGLEAWFTADDLLRHRRARLEKGPRDLAGRFRRRGSRARAALPAAKPACHFALARGHRCLNTPPQAARQGSCPPAGTPRRARDAPPSSTSTAARPGG